jgi:hypothetical protein
MRTPKSPRLRAAIEIAFIIFLFYSNLLMGEFTRTAGRHKTLQAAMIDIVTPKTFLIALLTAVAGHFAFELLRQKA